MEDDKAAELAKQNQLAEAALQQERITRLNEKRAEAEERAKLAARLREREE